MADKATLETNLFEIMGAIIKLRAHPRVRNLAWSAQINDDGQVHLEATWTEWRPSEHLRHEPDSPLTAAAQR